MSFSWTPHRFSGGALAFDVANSVILRFDEQRRIDRFASPGQMDRFAPAATEFCAERALFGPLHPVAPQDRAAFLAFRESIDRYFRARILERFHFKQSQENALNLCFVAVPDGKPLCTFPETALGAASNAGLADLLETLAAVLRRSVPDLAGADLGSATAHSTLRLIAMPDDGRMKICPNCGWLFLDRSKNKSRAWCDMAVCGNRAKASRHYHRRKQEEAP